MHEKVDPAALLLAVLAVGTGPLTTSGPWDPMNSVVAVIVATIVACFTWPTGSSTGFTKRMAFAQALAYGFIAVTFFAWPLQAIFHVASGIDCSVLMPSSNCYTSDGGLVLGAIPNRSTWFAFIPALVVTLVIAHVLRQKVSPRTRTK